jgi:redox-sensitive bicupin YhaK (pirin superfamily)
MDPNRKAYVHLIKGALTVNGQRLSGGDAAMIANESRIEINQGEHAEVLVFDLAA